MKKVKIFSILIAFSLAFLDSSIQASLQEISTRQTMSHPSTERIDFGFVLLTSDEKSLEIKNFAQKISTKLEILSHARRRNKIKQS